MFKPQQINCPGCGSPWSLDIKKCPYCGRPVIISSFDDVLSMEIQQVNQNIKSYLNGDCESEEVKTSLAMCYLRLKLFDKAFDLFQQIMQNQVFNSQIYFYSAVCLFNGKKPILAKRDVIDKALQYINSALMLEEKGIYHFFMAYIKYDYFERKFLNTNPNYRQCVQKAIQTGVTGYDINTLFDLLDTNVPSELFN